MKNVTRKAPVSAVKNANAIAVEPADVSRDVNALKAAAAVENAHAQKTVRAVAPVNYAKAAVNATNAVYAVAVIMMKDPDVPEQNVKTVETAAYPVVAILAYV